MKTRLSAPFRPRWEFAKRLRRLPTVETQVVAWLDFLAAQGDQLPVPYLDTCLMQRSGYQLYARSGFWVCAGQPLWGLTLVRVEIPKRYWRRGWLRTLLEMICRTMPHDLLVLEAVQNEHLFAAFQRNPAYRLFREVNFVRWDSQRLGELDGERLCQVDPEAFYQLGGKVVPRR